MRWRSRRRVSCTAWRKWLAMSWGAAVRRRSSTSSIMGRRSTHTHTHTRLCPHTRLLRSSKQRCPTIHITVIPTIPITTPDIFSITIIIMTTRNRSHRRSPYSSRKRSRSHSSSRISLRRLSHCNTYLQIARPRRCLFHQLTAMEAKANRPGIAVRPTTAITTSRELDTLKLRSLTTLTTTGGGARRRLLSLKLTLLRATRIWQD
mmetsp:Transcript_37295/g.69474  ORF Transcript_37295/g.69474 Transcript_37295/m.69474 type:complete len:205 (+) Transcript_37295:1213-1827(+)